MDNYGNTLSHSQLYLVLHQFSEQKSVDFHAQIWLYSITDQVNGKRD